MSFNISSSPKINAYFAFFSLAYLSPLDKLSLQIKSIGKYFHHSQNIQFEKEAKLYPDLAYPQIVDMIKRMKNLELKP